MSEQFKGLIEINNNSDQLTIGLDGNNADIAAGGNGSGGDLVLKDSSGTQTIWLRGQTKDVLIGPGVPGTVRISIDGNEGDIRIRDSAGREVLFFDASHAALYIGSQGNEGDLIIKDSQGRDVFHFDSNYAAFYVGAAGNEGDIIIRNNAGDDTFKFDGNEGDIFVWRKIGGVNREVMKFDASHAALYIGSQDNEGDLIIKDGQGRDVFHFDSNYAALYVGANGNEGDIIVRDGAGNERIRLDGNQGDIRLQNADCAEEFAVKDLEAIEPGIVMVFDEGDSLRQSTEAYDKKVAGVVSGAGNLKPGLVLDKKPEQTDRLPIALMGKVFCKVDAQYAPIQVGDLLTTSPTPGNAMKATDPLKAFGTIIGKALSPLETGKGLIPILVTLQ